MKTSFSDLINSDTPVLVDFYADWCGPCKMMTPVIKEIAQDMSGKMKVIKIDTDKNPAVSSQYGIQGIPTFILFKNGKILWRQSGAMPKHQMANEIRKFVPLFKKVERLSRKTIGHFQSSVNPVCPSGREQLINDHLTTNN
jgi:thioredoxin 1